MNADFDVIVVGAGPAGTAAAYQLKQLGYKPLLVDKQRFPRSKPCGGALSIKALNAMPWSVAPILQRAVTSVHVGITKGSNRQSEVVAGPDAICAFAVRKDFDRFNLDKVLAAGVEFEADVSLVGIQEGSRSVQVALGQKFRTARYVIGADGANSAVRRLVDTGRAPRHGIAMEGLVKNSRLSREPMTQLMFGYVEAGYGWLFPKADHVNVGLYTSDSGVKLGKKQLLDYSLSELGTAEVDDIVGFPIGLDRRGYSLTHQRVIFAGDAAGFAESLLGEGIYYAVKSGQAAARAIAVCDHDGSRTLNLAYKKELRQLIDDLSCCGKLAQRFYPNLHKVGFDALGPMVGKKLLMRGYAAGMTMHEMTNFFSLNPLRLLGPFYKAKMPPSLREFIDRQRAPVSVAQPGGGAV